MTEFETLPTVFKSLKTRHKKLFKLSTEVQSTEVKNQLRALATKHFTLLGRKVEYDYIDPNDDVGKQKLFNDVNDGYKELCKQYEVVLVSQKVNDVADSVEEVTGFVKDCCDEIRKSGHTKEELLELLKQLKKNVDKTLSTVIRKNRVRKRTEDTNASPSSSAKKQKLEEDNAGDEGDEGEEGEEDDEDIEGDEDVQEDTNSVYSNSSD